MGLFLFFFALIFVSCSDRNSSEPRALREAGNKSSKLLDNRENRLKETEKRISRNDAPYIVIDTAKRRIFLKSKGCILNEFELKVSEDSSEIYRTSGMADENGYQLKRIHIFRAIKIVGEMEIEAVAKALNMDYDDIQKYSPLDMSMSLSPGLIIRIRSDGEGERSSFFSNLAESTRLFFQKLFGAKTIYLDLKTSDAMAVYGACKGGSPTILVY